VLSRCRLSAFGVRVYLSGRGGAGDWVLIRLHRARFPSWQKMCDLSDRFEPGAKRRAQSAPSGKFSFEILMPLFLINSLCVVLTFSRCHEARFARRIAPGGALCAHLSLAADRARFARTAYHLLYPCSS
jgi:hypothetical protein